MAPISIQSVLKDINNKNLKSALINLKKLSGYITKEKLTFAHYSVLKQLNDYIYNLKEQNNEIKDEEDVYILAETCCLYLSQNWDCKRITFMQCLYHIQKYLINKNPSYSKNLCQFYFKLKNDLKIENWDDKENIILSHVFQDFVSRLFITNNMDIFSEDGKLIIFWISYLFKLVELQNYYHLYRIFDVLMDMLSRIRNSHGKQVSIKIGRLCLIELSDFFISNQIKQFNTKDFEKFTHFIEYSIYYSNQSCSTYFEPILKCIQTIDQIYPGSKCLPVETCIKLCSEIDEKNSQILLKDLLDLIEKCEFVNVSKAVSNLLLEFKFFFIEESPVKKNLDQIIKLFHILCRQLSNDLSSPRTCFYFSNMIYLSSFFILKLNSKDDQFKEILRLINPELKNLYSLTTCESIKKYLNLDTPINSMLNTALVYKSLELYKECAELCTILLMIVLKHRPEDIKDKPAIITFPSILSFVYNEIGLYEDAQMALIALATVHKNCIENIFKSWSDIKNKNINKDPNSNVVTILNQKGELIEKKYPPFKMTDVDVNMLLLYEVESYAKYKETRNCVLDVYDTATSVVQNSKMIISILVSAVDAITMQDMPKMSRFERHLHFYAQRIKSKLEIKNNSSLNLLLGNIYYQLVRIEILDLRKRTEEEFHRMKIIPKKPILHGDEGDELDKTSFASAFSYLQLDAQSLIFDNADKAIISWENAIDNIVNDFLVEKTLSYIKSLGYIYRLYSFKAKELQIWNLLFKLSSKISNIKYKILAFAEILTIKRSVSESSIENIKKEIENAGLSDKSYIKQLFNVNLAKYLYYNGKVDECLQVLNNLNDELTKYNLLVQFQTIFINTIAKQAKDKNNIIIENVVNPMITILRKLLFLIKQGHWHSFTELCVLQWMSLECSEYLGTFYVNANYVREACCYTNNFLEIAQKLALPLRACKLLCILSHVDINCNRKFECDMKLKEIETILDLKSVGEKENNDNCASPCLKEKINSQPHFLTANDNCTCAYCSNIDYQIICLNAATLRGLNLVSNDPNKMASVVFKVGYEIMKYIIHKISKDNNILVPIELSQINYYTAVSTANTIWGRYDKALKYKEIAIEMCKKPDFLHLFPKHTLLSQKNHILWKLTSTIEKPIKVNPRKRFEERQEFVKTPDNQGIPSRKEMRTRIIKNKEAISPLGFISKPNFDEVFRPIKSEEISSPDVKKQKYLIVPGFSGTNNVKKTELTTEVKKQFLPSLSFFKKNNVTEIIPFKGFSDDEATALKTKSEIQPSSTRSKEMRTRIIENNLDEVFPSIKSGEISTPEVKKQVIPSFFKKNTVKNTELTPFKIFCDDDFAPPLKTKSKIQPPSTRSKRCEPKTKSKIQPPSTRSKRCEPISPTFKIPASNGGKELIFDDSSDDEIQFFHRRGKSYTKQNDLLDTQNPQCSKSTLDTSRPITPKTPTSDEAIEETSQKSDRKMVLTPQFFSSSKSTSKTSRPITPKTPTSDEASIIEGTPPKSNRRIVLTPQILSNELSKLTLSKKASKKKIADKPTEPTKRCLRPRRLL